MQVKLIREVLRYPWEDEYLHAHNIYTFLEDLCERQMKCNVQNNTKLTAAQKRFKHKLLRNQPMVIIGVRGNAAFGYQAMDYLTDDDSLTTFVRNLNYLTLVNKITSNAVTFPDFQMQITYLSPTEDVLEHRANLD